MYRLFVVTSLFVTVFSSVAVSFAGGSNHEKQTPDPSPAQAAETELQGVRISGVLHIIYGDPPPGSHGKSRMKYMITGKHGQSWVLFFDKEKYWPADEVRGFNNQRVTVEGKYLAGEGSKTITVERIQAE